MRVIQLASVTIAILTTFMLASGCGDDASFQCGPADAGVRCEEDQICREFADLGGLQYQCVANPCGSGALSCDCAASVCQGFVCASVEDRTVSCVCISC